MKMNHSPPVVFVATTMNILCWEATRRGESAAGREAMFGK